MIDPNDQKTTFLPLDDAPAKRKRGRPSTGKALSRAEIQRQYRQRKSGNVTNNSDEIQALKAEIEELKVALGKAVAAQKREEERLIKVTKKESTTRVGHHLQMRKCGKRKWETISGEYGFYSAEAAEKQMETMKEQSDGLWEYRVKSFA